MIVLNVVIAVGALIMFFPFLWTIITSITPGASLTSAPALIPENPSLGAYGRLFTERPFGQVVLNSIMLAGITTAVQLVTSSTAAYAFSRLPFKGQGAVFAVYLATMMIPLQVLIVPLFVELKTFGLLDTYLGALLPTFASAFGIFLLRQAVNQVPRELDEAATLDGANHFTIYRRVIFPLLKPAIATVIIIKGVAIYNEFYIPFLYMPSQDLAVVSTSLFRFRGPLGTQWEVLSAGALLVIIPTLIVFLVLQRYIYNGLSAGATK